MKKPIQLVSSVLLALSWFGCGGGGTQTSSNSNFTSGTPGSSVTGTAATGLAIANAPVALKDSLGKSATATTDGSGNFTITTTGLTPPFLVQVSPTSCPGGASSCALYSVSADTNAATVINVTPLTDLVVRTFYSSQGTTTVANAFSNPTSFPAPTPSQVTVVSNVVTQIVQPFLSNAGVATSNFNLISTPFTASTNTSTGSGLDQVLDLTTVNVTTTTPTITITNGNTGVTQTSTVTTVATIVTVVTETTNTGGTTLYSTGTIQVPGTTNTSTTPTVSVSPQSTSVIAASGATTPLLATVTGLSNTAVTWSLSCPLTSCGTITSAGVYTPPANAPFPDVQVTVTALGSDNATTGTATVTVLPPSINTAPAAPPTLTACPLGGSVGAAYNQSVSAIGGTGPYSFSIVNGTLPAGLNLNASTGVITGTPTVPGTFSVMVTDHNGLTATGCSIVIVAAGNPTITCPAITSGEVGVAFSQSFTASGGAGPYSFSVGSGSLPAGLTLNTTTGAVTGTPTAAGSFSIMVTDHNSHTATSCAITIAAGPSITCPAVTTIAVHGSYNQSFAATGGVGPYHYTVIGTLPSGLALNPSTGVVSGTPGVTGSFQIKATDSSGATFTSCTITVSAVSVSCPANGEVGIAYNQSAVASGGSGSYTYSIVGSGSNQTFGLTLNTSTGAITGTPTASGTFQIQATDSNTGIIGVSCTITIASTPSVNCPSTAVLTAGSAATVALTVTGGTGPFTVSGSLPTGITASVNGATVALTAGASASPGTFTVTIRDAQGNTATSCTITVVPALNIACPPTAVLTAGTSGTVALTVSGGQGPYTVNNNTLPTGISAAVSAGTVTLSAGASAAPGAFTVTIRDSLGNTVASCTITVIAPPTIACPGNAALTIGSGTLPLTIGGGQSPFTVTGSLPTGVTATVSGSTVNVSASVSASPGTFTLTIRDNQGNTATSCTLTLTNSPTVSSPSNTVLTAGASGTVALTVNGGQGPFTVTNTLPTGITAAIAGNTITLSASALASPGTFTVAVRDSLGNTATSGTITVIAPPAIACPNSVVLTAGASGTVALTVNNGQGPFMVTSSLPTGITAAVSGNTVTLSAGPSASAGTFTVTITDNQGNTATSCTITVIAPPVIACPASPFLDLGGTLALTINGGQQSFAVTSTLPTGVTATVSGNTVNLSASASASLGTFTVGIQDALSNTATSCTITIAASGASFVTGTAAIGLALPNVPVTLKDAVGNTQTASTDTSGNFQIPTGGLTPPFFLQAQPATCPVSSPPCPLYSVSADANATTVINIDPVTDLVVRSFYDAQGISIDTAFQSPTGANAAPTPATVQVISDVITQMMQLWLNNAGVTQPFNLISTPFTAATTAPGAGFDLVLDQTSVNLSNAASPVVTITDGAGTTQTSTLTYTTNTNTITVATNTTASTGSSTSTISTSVGAGSTNQAVLSAIQSGMNSFASTVNSAGSSLTASQLVPFLDPNFLDGGLNQTQFADQAAGEFRGGTVAFSVNRINSLSGSVADVVFTMTQTQGPQSQTQTIDFQFHNVSSNWLLYGDQRNAKAKLTPEMLTNLGAYTGGTGPVINTDVQEPQATNGTSVLSGVTVSPLSVNSQTVFGGTPSSNPGVLLKEVTLVDTYQPTPSGSPVNLDFDHFAILSNTLSDTTIIPAGTVFTFTVTPVSGPNDIYNVPVTAFTNDPVNIGTMSANGSQIPGSEDVDANLAHFPFNTPITVNWTLPKSYPIAQVKLNAQTFTGDQTTFSPNVFNCNLNGPVLSASATSGQITIPPTCATTSGPAPVFQVNINVQTVGVNGESSNTIYFFNGVAPLAIACPATASGAVSTSFNSGIPAVTGGVGSYNFQIVNSSLGNGMLPAGLTLNPDGSVSGTPSQAGSFQIQVTDANGHMALTSCQIVISGAFSVSNPSPNVGEVGLSFSSGPLTPTGGVGPYTYSIVNGTLPGNLTLNTSTGAVSGTPSGTGMFSIQVRDTSNGSTATTTSSITIVGVPSLFCPAGGAINVPYTANANVQSGGSGTFTYSIFGGLGNLPAGMSLNTSTGALSGTPTVTGSFQVVARDSLGGTGTSCPIVINNGSGNGLTVSCPTSGTTTLTSGGPSVNLTVTGGTGSYSVPSGLNPRSGGIWGYSVSGSTIFVTETGAPAGNVTVTVQDSASATGMSCSIPVTAPPPGPSLGSPSATNGEQNVPFTTSLTATGGTAPFTFSTVNGSLPPGLTLSSTSTSPSFSIAGTPSGSGTFQIQVEDANLQIVTSPVITIVGDPVINSCPTATATVGTQYNGTIGVTGGVPTGMLSGVPTYNFSFETGSGLISPSGLSISSTGVVSGTPTQAGQFGFTVTDANGQTNSGCLVTINTPTFNINGNVFSANGGPNNGFGGLTITLSGGSLSGPVTTTTGSNGNYNFLVPNGAYTVTPSITGASSLFLPAVQNVTVNGNDVNNVNFTGQLGYSISGTVSYSGSQTGPIYLVVQSQNGNNGNVQQGTSISGPGAFTIQGVSPGTYTVLAWRDGLHFGKPNVNDPTATSSSFTVTTSNVSNISLILTDPSPAILTSAPQIQGVSPFSSGAVISYKGVGTQTNNGMVEQATSYLLQWCSDAACMNVVGSEQFAATGLNGGPFLWIVDPANTGHFPGTGTLTNGTQYYFRAEGVVGSTPSGIFSSPIGPVTIGAPTGQNSVSGNVTFTGNATGPLYVGFYDQNTGNIYPTSVESPSSGASYSVNVPTGSNYIFFGIVDNNNDGLIGPGDFNNTGNNNTSTVINGNTPNLNLTLPGANYLATVNTQTLQNGGNISYSLSFQVRPQNMLPIAVTLASETPASSGSPDLLTPMDIADCMTCGGSAFNFNFNLGTTVPAVGDTYLLNITYANGSGSVTTDMNVPVTIGAVLSAYATNLSPNGVANQSSTPSFSWTDPASASSYTYQFQLQDSNNNQIWQVPGNNSNANGFSSSITSLAFGTDPTNSNNTPSLNGSPVTSLSSGAYQWSIQVQDSNGNSATTQASFFVGTPPALSISCGTNVLTAGGTPNMAFLSINGGQAPYTITNISTSLSLVQVQLSGSGINITAPPGAATGSFTVTVKDSFGSTATSCTIYINGPSITVTPGLQSVTAGSPATPASIGFSVNQNGVSGPVTWSITGASCAGNACGSINSSGIYTPPATVSAPLQATITATNGSVSGSTTVFINPAGFYSVNGRIIQATTLPGNVAQGVPGVTVSLTGTGITGSLTATTTANGTYTIQNVPNTPAGGSYVVTPTLTGSPVPNSVFYPASMTLSGTNNNQVNGANVNVGFQAELGVSVTGAVSYTGIHSSTSGRIYLTLQNTNGSFVNGYTPGTSISWPGTGMFTINNVPPGSYILQGTYDNVGLGQPNVTNPTGVTSSAFTIDASHLTLPTVTLTDPGATETVPGAPTITNIAPENTAAVVEYHPVQSNGVEQASSYNLQVSTDSTFMNAGAITTRTFKANGLNGNHIWIVSGLVDNTQYFFRLQGVNDAGSGTFFTYGGPGSPSNSGSPAEVTPNALTVGNAVSGTVTFTGTATGPIYAGVYDFTNGNVYADVIPASPGSPLSSPQTYTVNVPSSPNPSSPNYVYFAFIDQDSDGQIGSGDPSNTNSNGTPVVITGPVTGGSANQTLSGANSNVGLQTMHFQVVNPSNNTNLLTNVFEMEFNLRGQNKVPVAVEITSSVNSASGANVLTPLDIVPCQGCGGGSFGFSPVVAVHPNVGDSYTMSVTYADGTVDTGVIATVTGFVGGVNLPSHLLPAGTSTTSTTPPFSWQVPATPLSSYTYELSLFDANFNTLWQIPSSSSNSNGFSPTLTGLCTGTPGVCTINWGTDPTGNVGNTPSVGSLNSGQSYNWQISVQDQNQNIGVVQVGFTP